MKTRFVTLALAGALCGSACAEKKQLTEMHDATVDMRDTTKELNKGTGELKDTTTQLLRQTLDMKETTTHLADISGQMNGKMDDMSKKTSVVSQLTGELYDASRQGVTLDLRRSALKALLEAQSSGKKIAEAAQYFMSFEYQFWTGFGQDETEEKRQVLVDDAVSEFFKSVKEFNVGPSTEINPLAQTSLSNGGGSVALDDDNRVASFNAIAAALHRVNRKQEEMHHKNPKVEVLSMLSLIERGLKAEVELNSGAKTLDTLPPSIKEVLNNKSLAVKLLQARHNFIAAIFLAEVSPVGAQAPTNTLAPKWATKMLLYLWSTQMGWKANLDRFNVSQLKQFNQYLSAVLATRASLKTLGIEPHVDSKIQKLFQTMNEETTGKGPAKDIGELNAARTELIGLLNELKK